MSNVIDFNKPYNRNEFIPFLQKFLPDSFKVLNEEIDLTFKPQFIKKVNRIGIVDELDLPVYEIIHDSENDPRVGLSRDSFRLIANYGYSSALCNFISKTPDNYRFSLININPEIKEGKVIKKYSNPRRYSFYLGLDAKIHTPIKFLINKGKIKNLKDLQERFSIEVVTKEFFSELSNWYFWALKNVVFPKDAEKEKNGRNIAVIRLITRLIFIWFMKQKKLIKDSFFDKNDLLKMIKNLDPNESSYYLAILQNLFFASLNTPQKERRFRSEEKFIKGYNPDFGDNSIYRYQSYFHEPKNIINYFKEIPFLNGGLFECFDRKEERIYIDGFSDVQKNQPIVPNFLFFSEEKQVDLNKDYGTKAKKHKVQGLLNLLQLYNFTIDESTPVDVEIALDPELLGRVFENLLASYNPETATTARKSTGSYYTPREIVDYMVTQSLKEYFKNILSNTENIEDKLSNLLSYEIDENPFNDNETDILINSINNLKIIDPAVGSGAFPMGVLQKLVLVLSKLDQHNEKWKQQQISAIEKNVTDIVSRRDSIEKVESNFQKNELDYGRKLYLIQNCIYGVDIQPIAIQIAKLRFFISLLVDEKNDRSQENHGIEPLPNIETKFVSANSLIGLETQKQLLIKDPRIETLEKELKGVRDLHFNASYIKEKEKLRKKDKEIRQRLTVLLKQSGFPAQNIEKIANWDLYNSNKFAPWFDPEWMFGVTDGFDIVIANPPYVDSENMVKNVPKLRDELTVIYETTKGNWDLYIPFFELSYIICRNQGILTFITPNKWLSIGYGKQLREYFLNHIIQLCNCDEIQVFEAGNTPEISFIKKVDTESSIKIYSFTQEYFIKNKGDVPRLILSLGNWGMVLSKYLQLLIKLSKNPKKVKDYCKVENPFTVSEAYKLIKCLYDGDKKGNKEDLKLINTGTIDKYTSLWGYKNTSYIKKKYKYPWINVSKFQKELSKRYAQSISKKIIITGIRYFECYFDSKGNYVAGKSTIIIREMKEKYDIECLLAILNSSLLSFYIKEAFSATGIDGGVNFTSPMIESLPIPEIDSHISKYLCELSNKINKIIESDDYLDNTTKQAKVKEYEHQIDQMVYKLYGLTEEEIKIVEGNSGLCKKNTKKEIN